MVAIPGFSTLKHNNNCSKSGRSRVLGSIATLSQRNQNKKKQGTGPAFCIEIFPG